MRLESVKYRDEGEPSLPPSVSQGHRCGAVPLGDKDGQQQGDRSQRLPRTPAQHSLFRQVCSSCSPQHQEADQ